MVKQVCISCKKNSELYPIFKKGTIIGDEDDYSRKVICKGCLEGSEEYGVCELCSEKTAYRIEDLDAYECGLYCKEHFSEVIPEDEDEHEDWESFGEYMVDPSHWD